tara:strand:- start:24219 stop:25409 length:1191 start_codon:yes stop_codon:yes gene_type:complete
VNSIVACPDSLALLRRGYLDPYLLIPTLALISLGFVMVASASFSYAEHRLDNELYFLKRHAVYAIIGAAAMAIGFLMPADWWAKYSRVWMLLSIALLMLVLVPGIGREFNGSRRWLGLGGMTIQVSELVKLATIVFLASYLQKHREHMATDKRPLGVVLGLMLTLIGLLILEPDFGSVVVVCGIFMALLFVGGVNLRDYSVVVALGAAGLWWGAEAAPYRVARLSTFLDPWSDPFRAGYQLTQSLIAFGRGEWWGVGLGHSIQKMSYLPEAHTDFVFAVYAEEFGFIGVMLLMAVFIALVSRIFVLSRRAMAKNNWYACYVFIGFGVLLSGQVFINLGVNAGLLPTKGLTLPFVSYGGSSLICCCGAMGLLLRLSHQLHSDRASDRVSKGGRYGAK